MKRKEYESPGQATDLAGIRLITFIEIEAESAAKLLRESFKVHPTKSLDKSEELGDSQVGYRSIHLICELGNDRMSLSEYKPFANMLFEIQIRTALQHAWAEIDHDRGYKFNGVLPSALRRRLNLLAGQLELADQAFSRLAADVDQYSIELRNKTRAGDLDIELSSASIIEYLSKLIKEHGLESVSQSGPSLFAAVIDELHAFGVDTLQDLSLLFSDDFFAAAKSVPGTTSQVGLLRKAMMFADVDKYFTKSWQGHWTGLTNSTAHLIATKWGNEKLAAIMQMLKAPRTK